MIMMMMIIVIMKRIVTQTVLMMVRAGPREPRNLSPPPDSSSDFLGAPYLGAPHYKLIWNYLALFSKMLI